MRSLLWKEWREQRSKLALASLLLASFAFCGLHARIVPDENVLVSLCMLAAALMPILIGSVLVASERDAKTLNTLLALPVKPSLVLAVKTLLGVVLCVAPLAIACIISLTMAGGREMLASSIIALFVRCTLATLALFFWMLTLTVRLPGETRATLLGLGVLVGWMIVTLGLNEAKGAGPSKAIWLIDPAVFLLGTHNQEWIVSLPIAALIQALIAGLLWFWAARQFSAQEAQS
jgi:hypothetical protein